MGRRWTVLGMAFGTVARAGEPFGQGLYGPGSLARGHDPAAAAGDRRREIVMTLIHLRDVRLCPAHHSAIVRMDDGNGALTMTFAADSHEAVRLGRVVRHGPQACHPIFDFVRAAAIRRTSRSLRPSR